jgi:microsomal dipeptidase-like Zn-dependent dipeptidase
MMDVQRRFSARSRRLSTLCLAVLAPAGVAADAPPRSASVDIYQYASECVALRDSATGRYVGRDDFGYSTKPSIDAATPFRMQATDLGSYLLYGPDGSMPEARASGRVVPSFHAGAAADWQLTAEAGKVRLTNVSTGGNLSVSWRGRVNQSGSPNFRWKFEPVSGCSTFPEAEVNAEGTPLTGRGAGAEVEGFLDAHVHVTAFEFLGGLFHCGRPWSRYGVMDALKDCPDHAPNGEFAFAENLLSYGTLIGTHSNDGWPNFDGWPKHFSLTHEGTYWKAIERAWRGGLRIMVADLVENRALCEIYWMKKNSCLDMDSLRLQARDLNDLQDYIDAQFKGPGKGFFRIVRSPAEARSVINEGKLAVVMGVEMSQPFDCLYRDGVEQCSIEQIEQGLREVWDLGVRSMFPVHKFDNAFGGTAMDDGFTGVLVNLGNKWMTGRWWKAETCHEGEHDKSPTNLSFDNPELYAFLRDFVIPLFGGDFPAYPPGDICNVRGLTHFGEYLINRMIDMGMIVETDHMSVRGRDLVLNILESRGYSGVITSHSWGDDTSRVRIQALGGVVSPYANTTKTFISDWEAARETQPAQYFWGIGYGTDTNGIGSQAAPRPGAPENDPVTYPYTTFDGGTTMYQNRWGERLWDFNHDGAGQYGLFPDWVEDMSHVAGQEVVDDLARGAEAYLQMWERAYYK